MVSMIVISVLGVGSVISIDARHSCWIDGDHFTPQLEVSYFEGDLGPSPASCGHIAVSWEGWSVGIRLNPVEAIADCSSVVGTGSISFTGGEGLSSI